MRRIFALALALLLLAPSSRAQEVTASQSYNVAGNGAATWQGFSPTWIPGVVLWLRADIGVTVVTGSVTAWADQSGLGNSATANTACTAIASAINGHAIVRCNGTTQSMAIPSSAALNFGTGSFDVFLVGTPQKASTFQVLLGKGSSALANNLRFFENGSNHPAIYWGSDSQAYSAPATNPALTAGTSTMVEWALNANGASSTQRLAGGGTLGTNTQTVSGTGSNSNSLTIGSDLAPQYFAQWDYAEIVMVKAYLNDGQRARMLAWVSNLYGLSPK